MTLLKTKLKYSYWIFQNFLMILGTGCARSQHVLQIFISSLRESISQWWHSDWWSLTNILGRCTCDSNMIFSIVEIDKVSTIIFLNFLFSLSNRSRWLLNLLLTLVYSQCVIMGWKFLLVLFLSGSFRERLLVSCKETRQCYA